jgi:hypothetical protein
MLFQYAQAMRGQTIMVVGAAGNVGAYAVQMAADGGIQVVAIAHLDDEDLLRSLGVKSIIDSSKPAFEQELPEVDAILDTVGGSTFQRCVAALKPGGKLVTSVSTQPLPAEAIFFYAEVTTARLQTLTTLFDAGRIIARVGSILPLSEARQAQRMLAGAPMPELDDVTIRIADIAAYLAVLGDRRRDELGSPTFPQFIARLNIRDAEIHKAVDVIRVGDAEGYRRLIRGRPAPDVQNHPDIRQLKIRRRVAVTHGQNASAEDLFVVPSRSLDVGHGEKMRDADPLARRHLIALLFDLYGGH